MSSSHVSCDNCSAPIGEGSGYLLTTRQVVTSHAFWQSVAKKSTGRVKSMDPNDLFLSMSLRNYCGQGSPWIVCEKCIARYPDVNHDEVREYAKKWWRDRNWTPPGNGPVDISVAIPFLSDKAADTPHLIASTIAQQVLEARASKPSSESAADEPKKKCVTCQTEIDINAAQCPRCGGTLFVMRGPGRSLAPAVERMRKRDTAILHNNHCGEYFQKKRFVEAEQELRQALEADPTYALTYSNMGLVMHEQGRLEEAITWLEKALELEPKLDGVAEGLAAYKAELAGDTRTEAPASARDDEKEHDQATAVAQCTACGEENLGAMGVVHYTSASSIEMFVCDRCVSRHELRQSLPTLLGITAATVIFFLIGIAIKSLILKGIAGFLALTLVLGLTVMLGNFVTKSYKFGSFIHYNRNDGRDVFAVSVIKRRFGNYDIYKTRKQMKTLPSKGSIAWYIWKSLTPSSWKNKTFRKQLVNAGDAAVVTALDFVLRATRSTPDGIYLRVPGGDQQRINVLSTLALIAQSTKSEAAMAALTAAAQADADPVIQPIATRYLSELSSKGTTDAGKDFKPLTDVKDPAPPQMPTPTVEAEEPARTEVPKPQAARPTVDKPAILTQDQKREIARDFKNHMMWATPKVVQLVEQGVYSREEASHQALNMAMKSLKEQHTLSDEVLLEIVAMPEASLIEAFMDSASEPPTIEKFEATGDVNALANVLRSDKDVARRKAAARALGTLGLPEVTTPLVEALKDESPDVRVAVIGSLSEIGGQRVVESLLKVAAFDSDVGVQNEALYAFRDMQDLDIEPILDTLNSEHPQMRAVGSELMKELEYVPAVPKLIELAKDANATVRQASVRALATIRDARAFDAFMAAIKDPDELVRKAAAVGLKFIKDRRAFDTFVEALGDSHAEVRLHAVGGLNTLADPKALPYLIKALGDEDWQVQGEAAQGLARFKDPLAVDPLIQTLDNENESVRSYAAEALGEIGEPRAIVSLIPLLRDEGQWARTKAGQALEKLGWQPEAEREKLIFHIAKLDKKTLHPGEWIRKHAQQHGPLSPNPPLGNGTMLEKLCSGPDEVVDFLVDRHGEDALKWNFGEDYATAEHYIGESLNERFVIIHALSDQYLCYLAWAR